MNARRIAKYRSIRIRRWSARHKRLLIIVGDVLLVLLLAWQLWPVSQQEIDRDQVDMRIETYYELSVNGKPYFYFAELNDSAEITQATANADSIKPHATSASGYWVNRIAFIPSCLGHVITVAPPKADRVAALDSTGLRRFVGRQIVRTDHRLAGLQHMKNELHYYLRKHDIADFGFTQISKFSAVIDHRVDSIQQIVDTLQAIPRGARLSIRYVADYKVIRSTKSGKAVNRPCRIVKSYNGEFNLVQLTSRTTPLFVEPRMSVTRGMEELVKLPASSAQPAKSVESTDSVMKMYYPDGGYYEGYWKNGKRNGFGFFVSPTDYLQVGTWKNDVFKGERLTYNANRIYGIDISRHQHERGSKKYSIDWSDMRITSLGSQTKKDVEGTVDYPVSFIYIKSTEGCTVLNPYFRSDYTMARKKGLRTGAYHFFSTTSPGYKQAWTFLSKTTIQKGDLAPVLDVEPTDYQVRQMGGAKVLLANVRQWLEVVYKQTGQRPILYIGQTFASKYLSNATDITGNYLVWVARYGEYHPNLKLAIWQLSSDGRVRGIHGNVDINVFSGYKSEYDEFIRKHTIGSK